MVMKINTRVPILREAIVKIANILAEKKVKVTQQGSMAYCEYVPGSNVLKRVNIPYIPDDATDELLEAVQGFVDHELGHVLFTDGGIIPQCKKEGVLQFWNMVEDTYVERMMAQRFMGSAYNLAAVGKMYIIKVSDGLVKEGKYLEALLVPMVRAWAGQKVFQDYMSDKWHLLPDIVSKLQPLLSARLPKVASTQEAFELALEVKKLMDLPESPTYKDDESTRKRKGKSDDDDKQGDAGDDDVDGSSDGDDEDAGDDDDGELSAKSGKGKGSKGKDKDENDDENHSKGKDKGEDKEKDKGSDGADDDSDTESKDASGDSDTDDGDDFDGVGEGEGDEEEEGVASKPEFEDDDEEEDDEEEDDDEEEKKPEPQPGIGMGGPKISFEDLELKCGDTEYDKSLAEAISEEAARQAEDTEYLIYTTDYDRLEPFSESCTDEAIKKMQDDVDHMVGPIQKDIERAIAARSASVLIPGYHSGKLHGAALHRVRFGRDDVFRRKTVNDAKDVACGLLIDMSGSMTFQNKLRLATYAGYALSSVLDRMNIPNEVLGFTTRSFEPKVYSEISRDARSSEYARLEALYMPVLKDFHERMGTKVKSRFAAVPIEMDCAENVDGECVMIAGRRLALRKEKRKILFVLSDGHPACSGNWRKQLTHLKAVVKSLESQKIEVVGIGIMDSAVNQFYSKRVVLQNIQELPGEVVRQLKDLLIKAKMGL